MALNYIILNTYLLLLLLELNCCTYLISHYVAGAHLKAVSLPRCICMTVYVLTFHIAPMKGSSIVVVGVVLLLLLLLLLFGEDLF